MEAKRQMRKLLVVGTLFILGACAGSPGAQSVPGPSVNRSGPVTTTVRADVPPGGGFRPPSVQRTQGLDQVIGARAEQLTASFGDARIDLSEGDARKLQFASDTCVLDVFLYPLEPGETPIATYAEARNPDGGAALDEAQCVRELARR